MRIRVAAGGIVMLALVAAPSATAQAPVLPASPAADATAERAAARGVQNARITLELEGVRHRKVKVGNRVKVIGKIAPFVPRQRVKLLFKKSGRQVLGKTSARIRRVSGRDVGRFKAVSRKVIEPGKYKFVAKKPRTDRQAGGYASSRSVGVDYPDLDPGDRGSDVRLFNNLLGRKAYYGARGQSYGSATQRAVLAFRKVNNLPRTTNATASMFKTLAAGKGGFRLKWPEGGKHVEVDLSRQVMVLARNRKPQHIFHISSGAPATPTVRGKFPVYRYQPGYNSKGMYYSVYFHGGYATHGYASVPTYPASHGCVRNPIPDSKFIYRWLDMGDVFYVYG